MKTLIFVMASIMAFVSLTGCKPARAEGYKFITEDFLLAIRGVNAGAFFSAPLPEVPEYMKDNQIYSDRDRKKYMVGALASHYEKIGDGLCKSIAVEYQAIMKESYKGEGAYDLDTEVTKSMRASGAMVLPLQVRKGEISAVYYNTAWKENGPEKGGNRPFEKAYFGMKPYMIPLERVEFKEHGIIRVLGRAHDNGGGYRYFRKFDQFATEQGHIELKSYDYDFDLVHMYLFVFEKDPSDLNQEIVFFYVNIPFSVSGGQKISMLYFQPSAANQVRCFTGSTSKVRLQAYANVKNRFDKDAASPLGEPEPLTIPLHSEYGVTHVPVSDKESGLIQNQDYEVYESAISEPSLFCWLNAMGFNGGEDKSEECTNTGYAEEYMDMLNKNICVRTDDVSRASLLTYPYKAKPSAGIPIYLRNVFTWDTRCNSVTE